MFNVHKFKKLTLLSVAGYVLIFAVSAKVVSLYATQHPSKDELLPVQGIVTEVKLGGKGRATYFKIESERGIYRYSSYYGKDWPGMERILEGDRIIVLAERNKLKSDEMISGKGYYIWELVHRNQIIVSYDDIWKMVHDKEAALNEYINLILAISTVFFIFAYTRKFFKRGT